MNTGIARLTEVVLRGGQPDRGYVLMSRGGTLVTGCVTGVDGWYSTKYSVEVLQSTKHPRVTLLTWPTRADAIAWVQQRNGDAYVHAHQFEAVELNSLGLPGIKTFKACDLDDL